MTCFLYSSTQGVVYWMKFPSPTFSEVVYACELHGAQAPQAPSWLMHPYTQNATPETAMHVATMHGTCIDRN